MSKKRTGKSKIIIQAVLTFVFVTLFLISASTAYVVFAPDSWPKPFYLMYQVPVAAAEDDQSAEEGEHETAEEESESMDEHRLPTPPPPAAVLEIRPGQGLMVDTGTKIVNLAEPSGRRYIRINIVLEFAPTDLEFYTMPLEEHEAYVAEFEEDIHSKLPVINDSIIQLMSSKTFEIVYTAEGKASLRNEILETINSRLPQYRVIFVYFTEFVVQ